MIISIISFMYHVWWHYSSLLPSYLQASRSQHTGGSSSSSSTHDGRASSLSLSRQEVEVSQHLQSDAVERYLFLCEYMHQCGILWSPVIVAMYCYGTLLIILMAYIFTTHEPKSRNDCESYTDFFPIVSLCGLSFVEFGGCKFRHRPDGAPLLELWQPRLRDDGYVILCLFRITIISSFLVLFLELKM